MSDGEQEQSKIMIDEDWKSQVEREKTEVNAPVNAEASGEASASTESSGGGGDAPALPPASFEILIGTMMTQAMACLGQFPDPATGEIMVNRDYAKFQIDLLGVLEEKTEGNLSEEEGEFLKQSLHQLRMLFTSTS